MLKVISVTRLSTPLFNTTQVYFFLNSASDAWDENTQFHYYGGSNETFNRSYNILRIRRPDNNNVEITTESVPPPSDVFSDVGMGGILIRI